MKMFKTLIAIATIGILLFTTACVTTTLHPIYERNQLIQLSEFEGEWISTRSVWTIKKDMGNSYKLSYKECDDPINEPRQYSSCTIADFKVHLIKLGDDYYADFRPTEYLNSENQFLQYHIRSLHSFARINANKERLQFEFMDNQWLFDYLSTNKESIAHVKSEQDVILTASTQELQKFIISHKDNEEAYLETIELHRRIVR